jgi:hypothetical protein
VTLAESPRPSSSEFKDRLFGIKRLIRA